MDDSKRVGDFLEELAELTEKYGIAIWGCGCCNSPQLKDVNSLECLAFDLEYNKKAKKYECEW